MVWTVWYWVLGLGWLGGWLTLAFLAQFAGGGKNKQEQEQEQKVGDGTMVQFW